MTRSKPDIDAAIEDFVKKCQEIVIADGRGRLGYGIKIGGGRKYTKIIMNTGNQQMVWAFIDRTNGDVLKPATWKAPAKHARGNLYDPHGGMLNINWTGPAYMDALKNTEN